MTKDYEAGDDILNLLQITDCHLTKHATSDLLGVVTRDSLNAVLRLIDENIAKKTHAFPDFTVATGDIAQDASAEAYQYFQQLTSKFGAQAWFSGNHDETAAMTSALADKAYFQKVHRFQNWQIIMLDSSVGGSVHGRLSPEELELLERALKEKPDLHTLVCLHHHPVDINSAWLDNIGLKNRDAFFSILDNHSNVKGVLWGHIHQEWSSERNGVPLLATPSTCIQFLPNSAQFAVENIAPGYRFLQLMPDGKINSKIYRAEDFEFTLDLESTGY